MQPVFSVMNKPACILAPIRYLHAVLGSEGIFGLLLSLLVAAAVFASILAPHNPHTFTGRPLERPSATHRLGTNDVGQDILSELIYGTRVSLTVAAGVATGTMILAVLIGGTAGYRGGWIDLLLMRLVDLLMALPRLPILILINAFLGACLPQMILTMVLLFWPGPARIIRAQVMSVRQRGYVKMARSFGGSPVYIFVHHILPPIIPLIIFGLVTSAGRAVSMEAGLAFLGLGDPTVKSWGLIMRYALNLPGLFLTDRWLWWLLPPGLCITLLILALTFIGMGIERHFDTRLRQR